MDMGKGSFLHVSDLFLTCFWPLRDAYIHFSKRSTKATTAAAAATAATTTAAAAATATATATTTTINVTTTTTTN